MDTHRGTSKLEIIANLATIFVSLLLSAVLIRVFLLPPPVPASSRPGPRAGMSLKNSLPGVDWARNRRTLVLAISTRCHFCTESAPFFQRIDKEKAKDLALVAVLPQAVDEGKKYLESEGVQVDDVKQAALDAIGVTGTPTLLLVDANGTVGRVWQGKLDPQQQAVVLAALNGPASSE